MDMKTFTIFLCLEERTIKMIKYIQLIGKSVMAVFMIAIPCYLIYALFESAGGIVRCLKEMSTYGEDIVQPDEEESTEEGV